MLLQGRPQLLRQNRCSILTPFAVPNTHCPGVQINILHPQGARTHAPVDQRHSRSTRPTERQKARPRIILLPPLNMQKDKISSVIEKAESGDVGKTLGQPMLGQACGSDRRPVSILVSQDRTVTWVRAAQPPEPAYEEGWNDERS